MPDYVVEVTMTVRVRVNDPDVSARCVENHDGWRDSFYRLSTPEQVAEHLAFNLGIHGRGLSQLDGWADLPDGAASAVVVDTDYADVREVPPDGR